MRIRELRTAAKLVAAVACHAGAQTDAVPTLTLTGAVARLEDGFSWIHSVRELADGRVILAASQRQLFVADFRTGRIQPLSRVGSGPGEYRDVVRLHPMAGDSTLAEDPQQMRWILFESAEPVATLTSWTVGMFGAILGGVDRHGRVMEVRPYKYGRQEGIPPAWLAMPNTAESLFVLLRYRTPAGAAESVLPRTDTVARLRGEFGGVTRLQRGTFGGGPIHYMLSMPFAAHDQAVMFEDGWIAIAFARPYRVEWRTPDGRTVTGQPLPFTRVPADQAQKAAAVAREWPQSPNMFTPEDYPPWPDHLPPFQRLALVPMADGRLAIRRTPDARMRAILYDLMDRAGRLSARLHLQENEQLFAVTERWAYVGRRDDDDLIWLERRAWPPR